MKKKIKKTWTLLPETAKFIEDKAKEESRNENAVVDLLVKAAKKRAANS